MVAAVALRKSLRLSRVLSVTATKAFVARPKKLSKLAVTKS
jgi:hypothetical protein